MASRRSFRTPLDIPIEVLGGKWKLLLLYYLASAPRRNGELLRLIPGLTQKMLTQQLRQLERDGMVHRKVFDQVPPKVVYSIDPAQRSRLLPLVKALCEWGYYWSSKIRASIDKADGAQTLSLGHLHAYQTMRRRKTNSTALRKM